MSDFLLLTKKDRCPVCFTRRESHAGNCHNCGVRLFMHEGVDFSKFEEETGIVNWWAYSAKDGFKHRDYYMVAGARPQVKRFEMPALDANYGKQITPEEVRSRKAQGRKVKLKEKKTIKPSSRIVYANH